MQQNATSLRKTTPFGRVSLLAEKAKSGGTLIGNESDGTILFTFTGGPVTSLSFTNENPEFWNGFTIGLVEEPTPPPPPAVPEPDTLALVGPGLLGSLTAPKRRFFA